MSEMSTDNGHVDANAFSEAFLADAERLVMRYPVARSALLPLLHLVQAEHGYVTDAGIAFCAERLHLTKAEVGAVSTFYTMFKREPVGDYLLSVCTQPTCAVAGSARIFDRYKQALGDRLTDPETKVSIEEAECLGICDAAPVVQVNYEMYGTTADAPFGDKDADDLLAGCRKGQPPVSPWSGEPAPTFAEVEREVSGANDPFADALVVAARHSVEGYDTKPAYKTGMTDLPVDHPGGDPGGHGGDIFRARSRGEEPAAPSVPAAPEPDVDDEPDDAVPAASSLSHGEHSEGAEQEPFTTGRTVEGVDRDLDQTVPDARKTPSDMGVIDPDDAGYPGTSGDIAEDAKRGDA